MRVFQLEVVEPAAKQRAALQFFNQRGNSLGAAGKRAVDAFVGQQHAALQPEFGADRAQRLAQLPEIRQRGELIEGGDLVRHRRGLSGGRGRNQHIRRRPGEGRNPYAVPWRSENGANGLCYNEHRWLWVPAFAGTTMLCVSKHCPSPHEYAM